MNAPREAPARHLATCSCGQLQAHAVGEPIRISVCHCLACQRRTGSVFAAQARFLDHALTIVGNAVEYVRIGDEGTACRFRFCPSCGATVYYTLDDMPGVVAIPVGAFADPSFAPPTVSVYETRKHVWVGLPADMAHEP